MSGLKIEEGSDSIKKEILGLWVSEGKGCVLKNEQINVLKYSYINSEKLQICALYNIFFICMELVTLNVQT